MTMNIKAACYLMQAFDPSTRKILIDEAVKRLRWVRKKLPFDAVAFRGVSGAALGPTVADRLGVNIIAIRKPGDGSHSSNTAEGVRGVRYIVIDDFVSSGKTLKTVVDTLSDCTCVGIYCYCPEHGMTPNSVKSIFGFPVLNYEPRKRTRQKKVSV
jgi:orotate phosphoribosyltransferase-like protein